MSRDPYSGQCIYPTCDNPATEVDERLVYALNDINKKFPHVCQCHTSKVGGHDYGTKNDYKTKVTFFCKRPMCSFEEVVEKP